MIVAPYPALHWLDLEPAHMGWWRSYQQGVSAAMTGYRGKVHKWPSSCLHVLQEQHRSFPRQATAPDATPMNVRKSQSLGQGDDEQCPSPGVVSSAPPILTLSCGLRSSPAPPLPTEGICRTRALWRGEQEWERGVSTCQVSTFATEIHETMMQNLSWCWCCRRHCCTLQIMPGRDEGSYCANLNMEMRTRPAAEANKICYLAETGHWKEPEQGLGLVSDWLVREHSYYSSICLASRARRSRKDWGGVRRWGVESCQTGRRRQRITRRCKEQEDRKMDLTVEREEMDFKVPVTVRSLKTIEKGSVCGGE